MLFSKLETDGIVKTIAVIGGGPAGTMAAEKLARHCTPQARARVILFEEKPNWEKPCGGGLPAKALNRYPFLLEASDELKCALEAELVAPNGSSARFSLREPLAIYSRRALNQLLLRRAEQAGTEIVKERIIELERAGEGWWLKGRRGTYHSDYLILATGARSRLRRFLAEDFKARDFMLTFGYYVPARDDLLRIQFFEDFEGYAWSFPRPDHLSVGICGKLGESRMPEMRDRLHAFMKKFRYSTEGASVYSHLLPSLTVESWSNLCLAGRGWALAGDAAGLVDPMTGEGIYYAMRSGELLAESLLADSAATYPLRVRQEFGRALALGARLAPFFYRGDFMGAAATTRLVEFARRSATFMNLLQDLVAGSQGYVGLARRLYRGLGAGLVEFATSTLREQLIEMPVASSQLPVVNSRGSLSRGLGG